MTLIGKRRTRRAFLTLVKARGGGSHWPQRTGGKPFIMAVEKILVVDDEAVIRKVMEEWLRYKRYSVHSAGDLETAERMLQEGEFDMVFMDRKLPDGEGTSLLEKIAKMERRPHVVMMTGMATIESAVAAVRFGAFDYIIKPFSKSQVELVVKRADSFSQVVRVNQLLSAELTDTRDLLGQSAAFLQLHQMVRKVAPTEATVLIQGENGTGKELIAREIFHHSARRDKPYIKVNCAALPENLIESEFFGHEKGSFTGATERREGRFELADGGTLLLDEVSEIPPRLQAKLLRALQEREFERVGGTKTIKVDVRVLATTNRDLRAAVDKGDFREDLYYRLNVFPIFVPSLRERSADIPLLAQNFLQRSSRKHGVAVTGFSPAAIEALCAHRWPGNIRELQNTVERAVILTDAGQAVEPSALGFGPMPLPTPTAQQAAPVVPLESPIPAAVTLPVPVPAMAAPVHSASVKPLHELEKEAILLALEQTGGNRTRAAELLHISIRTLRNKLNEYRVADEPAENPLESPLN